MFSSMKIKEYMKYELFCIFRVKLVTKNIVCGPRGPNAELFLQCDVSYWRNIQIFWAYRNYWTPGLARVGRWSLDAGLWTLDSGRWTLDAGHWTLDSGLWTLDPGL